jgi:hypothetical protein
MKNYLLTNAENEVLSIVECIEEITPNVPEEYQLIQTTADVIRKYNSIKQYKVTFDPKNGSVNADVNHPNTDWSFINFTDDTAGNASLEKNSNGESVFYINKEERISNAKTVVPLSSNQITNAFGDVLLGGLGMGMDALLVACKDDVTSVTVVEIHPDVIELFKRQEFDMSKITVLNEDIYDHEGTYDCVLMDYHYSRVGRKDDSAQLQEKLSAIKSDNWDWYLDALDSPVVTPELLNSISIINDKKGNKHKPLLNIKDLISAALDSIRQYGLPFNEDTVFNKEYYVYNISNDEYHGIVITWEYFDNLYYIEYQRDAITDFYEISNPENAKLDKEENIEELPAEAKAKMEEQEFPYLSDAFYYSEKPYGEIVKCKVPLEIE